METDIHMFVEYADKNFEHWLTIRPEGEWDCSTRWQIHRDYNLFSTISGVRGKPSERPSVMEFVKAGRDPWWPRDPETGGVATGDDSSRALAAMSRDAHHEGWVSHAEVMNYVAAYPDARDDLDQILDLFEHLEIERNLGIMLDGIRLVFFYDN